MSEHDRHDLEAELLRRAQAGDDAAIRELLRLWQPSLESIARSFNRRHSRLDFDTHDLVSTTIRRMLRIDPDAIGDSSGSTLLSRILRDAYVDKVRGEVGRRRRQAEAVRRAPSADDRAPAHELEPSEVPRELAPEEWELVLLWKQGLSWSQISEHLGVPSETARRRWHRLMRRLREQRPARSDAEASASEFDREATQEGDPPFDPTVDRDPPPDRPA